MSTGIFSIGTSGLSAAYAALRTAGNNIANVNVPGYSRQTVVMSPQVGTFIGGNYLGQGVAVTDIRRVYSDFLTQQAHAAQAAAGEADVRYTQLAQVSNLFADPNTGIGATIDQFFQQVQDLSQRPADPATRQALLSAADLMARRFNDVGDRLQEFRSNSDTQIRQEVDAINRTAKEVADLNDKIALARGAGRSPNDLMDRRDVAIRKLNESIRVTIVEQDDGAANLFLGNGQPLVVGNRAFEMGVAIDPIDPQDLRVGIKAGTTLIPLGTDAGGSIGGLLTFRSQDLPRIENELGRLATTLTQQFNTQHRLGNDRNGAAGGDFFKPISANAFAATTNTGAATITAAIADATQLKASDYRVDFSAGTYTLTRLADGQSWTSATPTFNQDGLTIALAATPPANGDKFLVQAVRGGARSIDVAITQPNQIAAANPVAATMPATNTGSLEVQDLSVVGPTRNANLTQTVVLNFTNANTYTYTIGAVTSAAQTYTPGTPININGWSLTLQGTPRNGDQLTVAANTGGIGDNRNAIKLAQLANSAAVDGGALSGAFSAVVARVGGETQSAGIYADAQGAILNDSLNAESSVSGVNLDEEASRLMQFQQQYQAAAKVIATAKAIFDEILSIGR
jgi:flagellar hook-associated protein 1 FlgK